MKVEGALFEDSLCRTCIYASWDVGMAKSFSKRIGTVVVCGVGCFEKGVEWRLRRLPVRCRYWKGKEGGGEWMGLLDFSRRSQTELEEELRRIREERSGRGKDRRKVVRERKVREATAVKKIGKVSKKLEVDFDI